MKAPFYTVTSLHEQAKQQEGELPDNVFQDDYAQHLIFDLIRMERANRRQGTHSVKVRDEVRGGGRKPWAQKGTGNARQGSIRSPQWRGGGIVHGPQPRSYRFTLPRKVRKKAFAALLSHQAQGGRVTVLADYPESQIKSTKDMQRLLNAVGVPKMPHKNFRGVFLTDTENFEIKNSLKNIPYVCFMHVRRLNAPEIWGGRQLIFTNSALEYLKKGPTASLKNDDDMVAKEEPKKEEPKSKRKSLRAMEDLSPR